ncbi:structure-specific endonuclease subunit SLX4 [Histoplasma ohiense]|nr:structure-specific endonuclease subunit SLX4 [Histoplasma ohiense (nom. inval.)]
MDNSAITSQSNPTPLVCSVTPIIVGSPPSPANVIELSSPSTPPTPLTFLASLSKTPSRKTTNPDTNGENTICHGVRQVRRVPRNNPGREKKSITGPSKEHKQRTRSPKTTTRREIKIVEGDSLIVGHDKREKKGATTKRMKKRDGVADKKLYARVSKVKSSENLDLDANIPSSKVCNNTLPLVGDDMDNESSELQLEQAIKRRHDWTPAREVTTPVVDVAELHSSPCGKVVTRMHGVGTLLSDYGFSGVVETSLGTKSESFRNAPTTKRPMELQKFSTVPAIPTPTESSTTEDVQGSSSKQQRVKAKKPQKGKLTTITSHATAKYCVADQTVDLDYIQNVAPKSPRRKNISNRPSGMKHSNSGRGNSSTLKNDNGRPVFRVVPPLEAFKSFEGQELLFGTSSQLERGYPEYQCDETQDTQHSRSNSAAVSELAVPYRISSEGKNLGSSLFGLSGSKNLWSASARDLTGAVFEVDEIDFQEPSMGLSVLATKSRCHPSNRGPPRRNLVDVDNVPDKKLVDIDTTEGENGNHSSVADNIVDRENLNSKISANTSETNLECAPQNKPAFSRFTTSELAKNVAAYGFKPIKSRDNMISLLEKCWETQSKTSMPESKPNQGTDDAQKNGFRKENHSDVRVRPYSATLANRRPPKKRQAKALSKFQEPNNLLPIENSTTTASMLPIEHVISSHTILINDDQLSDSVGETVSLLPSLDHNGNGTTLQENMLEIKSPATPNARHSGQGSSSASFSIEPPSLASQITKAIKSQPRTRAFNGLKQPTWYEKILMYDPIQLEDLAAWLNTDGFGRIGEDREVGPGVVREWCESKGVCCVWKKQVSGRSHCLPMVS